MLPSPAHGHDDPSLQSANSLLPANFPQSNLQSSQPDAGPSRPTPKPANPMVEKLFRTDIQAIKQELHDALGEAGLAYWKTLNGYILGQVSRGELEVMVRGWLKGSKGGSLLAFQSLR